ncbi:LytR/AlgR family response regulator transcription factor [Poritiphilus flavus]|uniref:HTH LytTR-type domain-containing protein n=1 Tax=Poritiphilus flavus TaxID=2697053 RepID=A0A6L9EGA0_9FLAO|nr:LytTR family DNA-binding domain-containing protein [Poritiphilus flavus]NAS13686.1 hypothetical protein [Poritiphilus flavus]
MPLISDNRRFYLFSTLLLLVFFIIAFFQNFIKYSNHSSYSVWTTIIYLSVLLFLFVPVLIACVRVLQYFKARYLEWYWYLSIGLALFTLAVFFVVSNVILHSVGFFDSYLDANFVRYYFGREALFHLILIVLATFFVYYRTTVSQKLQVYKGRKKLTIGVDLVHWIEVEGHYLNFYTATDSYIKRERIGVMAKRLSPEFIRIHRKFLVNKNQIASKEKEKRDEYVVLSSGKRLKIGPSYSKKVTF